MDINYPLSVVSYPIRLVTIDTVLSILNPFLLGEEMVGSDCRGGSELLGAHTPQSIN